MSSTPTNTLGVERRASSSFAPATPKRLSMTDVSSAMKNRRVDDESDIEKIYSFGEVLGQGAFGVVREVTNRQTHKQLAMKIVHKDKPGSNAIQLLEREVDVLKRVNHPYIIQLEEVFETSKKMYLIMELCKGGELSLKLREKTYFKEEEAKTVMRRLTEAVVYMHDNDMVHRDLKLENVLLSTADPDDKFNIKVTDFGLAHMKGLPGCDDLMHSKCGTLYYMAPEVLDTRHEYTKMCDVWSLGVIMYTLLCGRVPFQSDNPGKLEELIMQGELKFGEIEWINVSQSAKELIQSMLCVDTSRRYTARKILDDPWFTGQAPHKTLNALDLMIKLESETTSGSNSTHQLEPLFEGNNDDQTLTVSDPHDRGASPSRQKHSRDATTPTRRKPRGKAQSTSMLTPGAGSGNCKNHSITSVGNGKLHSSHTSGYSSHNSQHHSNSGGGSEGKAVRTRTVSVGSKPVSSSSTAASQRRPSSGGHTSHRDKRHSTSSHNS